MSGAQTITLPGPSVTRSITWDAVRAYLRAEGWAIHVRDKSLEQWRHPDHVTTAWVGWWAINPEGGAQVMETTISTLARLANVSPGEMLARIALPSAPDCCASCGRSPAKVLP